MKRIGFIFIALIAGVTGVVSCDGMDSVYQEFIGNGITVTLAKLEGVELCAGVGKVKLQIPPQTDPRITGVKVYWDNRSHQAEFSFNRTEFNEIILEDISEGAHIFELISSDGKGNGSIPITLSASSYGDHFLSEVVPSVVTSACTDGTGKCLFMFSHSTSPFYQYLELTYPSTDGSDNVLHVKRGTNTFTIYDLAGKSYTYKSVFKAEETAFETIESEFIQVNQIPGPDVNVEQNVSLLFPRGYIVTVPFSANWEYAVSRDEASTSWLSVEEAGNTLVLQTLSRNNEGVDRVGTISFDLGKEIKTITITQKAMDPLLGTAYINKEGVAEGIIYWKNPEKSNEYKVISAKHTNIAWSTKNSTTNATSYTGKTVIEGIEYDNCGLIRSMPDYRNGNDYALAWVEDLGEGWYLPSMNELKDEWWSTFNGTVFDLSTKGNYNQATDDEKACRDSFEAAVAAIGGDKINMGSKTGVGTWIWTNTELNTSQALAFRVSNSAIVTQDKTNKSNVYTRGIKVVTID